jgi:putative Holliday junction resolvase
MRILALDIGDVWIGVAHTDPTKTIILPFATWKKIELITKINKYLSENTIEEIIIGLPITLNGNFSNQTNKIIEIKADLEKNFNTVRFTLFDERLSSKFAKNIQISNNLKRNKSKKNKNTEISEHSIAASIILEGYLNSKKNS